MGTNAFDGVGAVANGKKQWKKVHISHARVCTGGVGDLVGATGACFMVHGTRVRVTYAGQKSFS